MAIDTVVLSPEYVNVGRREAQNTTADQRTGSFVSLAATGKFVATTAAAARQYIMKENIATAQDVTYRYAADEAAFAAALPAGCRVGAAAGTNAEYAAGSLVEIGSNGLVVAQSSGVAVGVVVKTVTPQVGELIAIDLL